MSETQSKTEKLKQLKIEKVKPKQATVTKIEVEETSVRGNQRHRLTLYVDYEDTELHMSDAWVMDRSGSKKVKTMWINPEATHISKRSNLGKVMKSYDISSVEDFEGLEISVFPDLNNYLVVAACPVEEEDLNPSLSKEDFY